MGPGAWRARGKALNCTCAWPFPPPQVYPGPEAGARLLREFSGGGVPGDPQWLPASSRLARTRTRPTLPSPQRPRAPPRPRRLGKLTDQYLSRSEIRCPPLPTLARLRRGRGGREKGSNAPDSLTSCSQALYARRGARSSPAALGPPDPPMTTEGGGGGRGGEEAAALAGQRAGSPRAPEPW